MPTPPIMVVMWWAGLVPLVCVAVRRMPLAYWWLALSFAVSWVADLAALATEPHWISRAYPVLQSALVLAVFFRRGEVLALTAVMVIAGICSLALQPTGHDIVLHVIAWGFAVLAADEAPEPLKRALLAYFALGILAWIWYVALPGWGTWGAYQATRALGITLFGYACWKPTPQLRLT